MLFEVRQPDRKRISCF